MFEFKETLYFIQRLTAFPAPIDNSEEKSALHEFIVLCYSRLHTMTTSILPLIEKLEYYPQMYFGIGLLIRSVLTDVLALQFMLTLISQNGKDDKQILELERISTLFVKDGIYELLHKAEIDLSKGISKKDTLDNLKNKLAEIYPDDFYINEKKELEFNRLCKNQTNSAKFLYKKLLDYQFLPNRETIAQIFEQYEMFSKFEHLSRLTTLFLNITFEKKVQQIEKSTFYFLLHLDNILQLFKNIDKEYVEKFELVRRKLEPFFKPTANIKKIKLRKYSND